MNPAQSAQYLAWFEKHKNVIKAHAMGEEIERNDGGRWTPVTTPLWSRVDEYRVKPKPRSLFEVEARHPESVSHSLREWHQVCDPTYDTRKAAEARVERFKLINPASSEVRIVEYTEKL